MGFLFLAQAGVDVGPAATPTLATLIGSPLAAVGTATLIGSYVLKGRVPAKLLPLATGGVATALLGLAWALGLWAPASLDADGLAAPLMAIVTLIGPSGLFEFLRATPLPVGKSTADVEAERGAKRASAGLANRPTARRGNAHAGTLVVLACVFAAALAYASCVSAAGARTPAEANYFAATEASTARVLKAARSIDGVPSAAEALPR